MLLAWLFHLPRYFLGHVVGHAALLARWFGWALEGLSDSLTQIARWLCDLGPSEDLYDDFDISDDEDGLA